MRKLLCHAPEIRRATKLLLWHQGNGELVPRPGQRMDSLRPVLLRQEWLYRPRHSHNGSRGRGSLTNARHLRLHSSLGRVNMKAVMSSFLARCWTEETHSIGKSQLLSGIKPKALARIRPYSWQTCIRRVPTVLSTILNNASKHVIGRARFRSFGNGTMSPSFKISGASLAKISSMTANIGSNSASTKAQISSTVVNSLVVPFLQVCGYWRSSVTLSNGWKILRKLASLCWQARGA